MKTVHDLLRIAIQKQYYFIYSLEFQGKSGEHNNQFGAFLRNPSIWFNQTLHKTLIGILVVKIPIMAGSQTKNWSHSRKLLETFWQVTYIASHSAPNTCSVYVIFWFLRSIKSQRTWFSGFWHLHGRWEVLLHDLAQVFKVCPNERIL